MSGSPRRRRARCKEDISGQFRVTVPDAGELDQLRTQGGVFRRGLYTARNRDNAPHERTWSLPASSPESSTELMDTDDARRASEEFYRRITQQAGLSRSGSVEDVTLQPESLGVMTQGKLVLRRRASEQPQAGHSNVRAVGGDTLLNIPPCSMAEEPGEQSQKEGVISPVGVQRICRRFSKFVYVEVWGNVCSLRVRGLSRRRH